MAGNRGGCPGSDRSENTFPKGDSGFHALMRNVLHHFGVEANQA